MHAGAALHLIDMPIMEIVAPTRAMSTFSSRSIRCFIRLSPLATTDKTTNVVNIQHGRYDVYQQRSNQCAATLRLTTAPTFRTRKATTVIAPSRPSVTGGVVRLRSLAWFADTFVPEVHDIISQGGECEPVTAQDATTDSDAGDGGDVVCAGINVQNDEARRSHYCRATKAHHHDRQVLYQHCEAES